jgi:cytochrome c biogenesis protein CcdA
MDPLLGPASLAAAFFGGMLALLAPCCLTFLLPSYLAAGIQHGRWQLVRMTFIFAAGLAAVLLPVTWSIAGLAQIVPQFHRELFLLGGVLLLALGALSLRGGWSLPVPWAPRIGPPGTGSVFSLGAFSGIASSCCAPVLAGVLALGVTTTTWWMAIAIGVIYVFGMVFPLLLVALFGQRLDLLSHPALRARLLHWRMLGRSWSATTTNFLSAALLWSMGVLVLWVGWAGETSYSPDALKGIYAWLRDTFASFTNGLGPLSPLVVVAAVLLIVVLIRGARNARTGISETGADA